MGPKRGCKQDLIRPNSPSLDLNRPTLAVSRAISRTKNTLGSVKQIRAPFSRYPLRYGRPGVRDFVGNRCSFAILRTDHVVAQVAKGSQLAPSCSSHAPGSGLTPGAESTSISLKNLTFFDKCLCPDRCAVRKISNPMPQRFG